MNLKVFGGNYDQLDLTVWLLSFDPEYFVFLLAVQKIQILEYTHLIRCLLFNMNVKFVVISREEHRLRAFQDRLLSKIFWSKRYEATGREKRT
jgi:hypothetical protein